MRLNVSISCALLALVAMSATGCERSTGTVPIQGRVFYRGEPIAKGAVTFFPATGRPVTAVLSEDGDYTAELMPGEYTVVVDVGVELPAGYKASGRC